MAKAKLIINGEREFAIDKGIISLGRTSDNTISLSDDSNVSRYHVEIETRGEEFWLIELGSSNGTTVNGQRIYSEKILRDGDVIVLGGSSEIIFELEKAAQDSPQESPAETTPEVPKAAASVVQTPSVLPNAAAPESAIAADTAKASKLPLMLGIAGVVCGLAVVFVVLAVAITFMGGSSKCEAKATIKSPEMGELISKETEVEIEAQNTDCVKRAIFLLDGAEFASATDEPYSVTLDPKQFPELSDGANHSLKVVFEDAEGNKIMQPDEVLLGFETLSTPTPTPEIKDTPIAKPPPKETQGKQASPTEILEFSKNLLQDFPGNPNYKFDQQFLQEVQKKTSEYASEGYFSRAQIYRDAINVSFQETSVGVPLGYITAMSRSQFKPQNQPNGQGLWRMSNELVTGKGYDGLCGAETISDPKQNCAARAASLYLKDLLLGYFAGDEGGVVYAIAAFGMLPQDASVWKNSLPADKAGRLDFWKVIKSKEQREEVVRFFAAGIVAKNPQRFGLKKDIPISELYKNFVSK
jgi:hypothetical protein